MKYSIERFSQQKLIDHGLDCRDAIFLGWMADFQSMDGIKKHIDGDSVFYWLQHKKIIDELPILGISTLPAIGKYLKSLVTKDILEQHIVRRGTDKGTAVFYRVVPNLFRDMTTSTPAETATTTEEAYSSEPSAATTAKEHYAEEPSSTLGRTGGSDSSSMSPLPQELERGGDEVPRATREPESTTQPEPPPQDNKPPEKMTRDTFRQSILDVLRENNPVVQTPYEADYKAAEDAAREHGGQVYLDWLTAHSKKHPTKRLFFLHQDHIGELWAARQAEAERAETERKKAEREANRCKHGHLTPEACRECFHEKNGYLDNPFGELLNAIVNDKREATDAEADRNRQALKVI